MSTSNNTPQTTLSLAQDSTEILFGTKEIQEGLPEVAKITAAEGIVLLKNNNNTLPFSESDTVAVFGRVQCDWFYVGYGSGGDVKPPYKVNLMEGIKNCGKIAINQTLADNYETWCKDNPVDHGEWASWPRYYQEMPLSKSLVKEAAESSSKAIVIIGRAAGEARENTLEEGSYYLTLEEKDMLDKVTSSFENTTVILNCGNIIDMAWTEQYGEKISAIVYAWQGGMESGNALADVLCGNIPACGRLTDTIARNYEDYPSSTCFGGRKYNNYVEDIFVGYRYFETFAKDAVLFPFGYGLNFTEMVIKTDSVSFEKGNVIINTTVSNAGKLPGKETIQVYYNPPQGVLGKPLRNLATFAKTKLLNPRETQSIQLSFKIEDMASYDDAGLTGHKSSYLLEAGAYEIYVGKNVRDAKKEFVFNVDKLTIVRQLDEVNALPIKNQFKRMVARKDENSNIVESFEAVPTRETKLKNRILNNLPNEIPQTEDKDINLQDVKKGTYSMDEFIAQLTPKELDLLCRGDEIMGSPLGTLGNAGVFGGISESLRKKGVPPITTTDGPSGLRLSTYTSLIPCGTAIACTWNVSLAKELSSFLAKEMIMKGSDVLLSPGMNIHRNPLGGRNFEYFSEDPHISGHIASAIISGIQSQGVAACPKHFACNNQELERNTNDSRVSERALREIYLKGFEICVKESQPQTLMTSYNLTNGIWNHYNYDLCTTVLRKEWGYEGVVMTDWWTQPSNDPDFADVTNNAYRVRSQVDVLMPGGTTFYIHENDNTVLLSYEKPNGLTLGEMQRSAKNVLNFIIKTNAINR